VRRATWEVSLVRSSSIGASFAGRRGRGGKRACWFSGVSGAGRSEWDSLYGDNHGALSHRAYRDSGEILLSNTGTLEA
jgi:hypothetical protein